MSPRVLFAFSGLLAGLWMIPQSGEPRALANRDDYYCATWITLRCPCEQADTLCCPRGQYGPTIYSCQAKTGSVCVDTTAGGQPLQVPCPGYYHTGTCGAAPLFSCFRGPATVIVCPQAFAGTCAPVTSE